MNRSMWRCWVMAAFAIVLSILSWSAGPLADSFKAESITLYEAEVLIYLLPEAHEVRSQGMDVGWEQQQSPSLNLDDFFVFWVVNAKRKDVHGSVTIGFFSVNKHTADIWDNDLGDFVATPELQGVQRILREAHHIDEAIMEKFRSRRPFLEKR